MEVRMVTILCCGLLCACHPSDRFDVRKTDIFYVKDYNVSAEKDCRTEDVNLNNTRAKQFFTRARAIDYETMNANYPVAPCDVVGTVSYDKHACDWEVSAAGTAWVACDEKREQRWYFACDDCSDLLTHAD